MGQNRPYLCYLKSYENMNLVRPRPMPIGLGLATLGLWLKLKISTRAGLYTRPYIGRPISHLYIGPRPRL